LGPCGQAVELGANGVDAFDFHDLFVLNGEYLNNPAF
jgi:hypothetical protein